jgi:predicted transcriptional regulator
MNLNTLATVFTDVLSLLNHRNTIRVSITVYENKTEVATEANGCPGRPRFVIRAEMLEELRELGFSWTKKGEILGVSRWTIHRRVAEYGLENTTGFHHLPDEELDEKVKEFILNHGCTTGQLCRRLLKSVGLRTQRKRIRESMARVDPHNTALRYCYFSQAISSSLAKFPMAPGWLSFFD